MSDLDHVDYYDVQRMIREARSDLEGTITDLLRRIEHLEGRVSDLERHQ